MDLLDKLDVMDVMESKENEVISEHVEKKLVLRKIRIDDRNSFQGDPGEKGEPGQVKKVAVNGTHLLLVGPPGVPGPKVLHFE